MKKCLIILLMLVYGISSMGMTVHFHYCCGKLDKVSLAPSMKACSMQSLTSKGCCDTKTVEIKVKADQETAGKWISKTFITSVPVNHNIGNYNIRSFDPPLIVFSTGPPLTPASLPIFIKNCHFRI